MKQWTLEDNGMTSLKPQRKNCEPRILYTAKTFFQNEGKKFIFNWTFFTKTPWLFYLEYNFRYKRVILSYNHLNQNNLLNYFTLTHIT